MSRRNRFIIGSIISFVLLFLATNAWAAQSFESTPLQGSIPEVPDVLIPVTGECAPEVNMGTGIFSSPFEVCVTKVEQGTNLDTYAPAPEGKIIYGDIFIVTTDPINSVIKVCYAFPPEFAEKSVMIYRLDEIAIPKKWVEISESIIKDGTICANSPSGIFTLFGNP